MSKGAAYLLSVLFTGCVFFILGCAQQGQPAGDEKKVLAESSRKDAGEELFDKHCIFCHKNGDRIRNVRIPADIVDVMRSPKGSMPKFGEKEITDEDAAVLSRFIFIKVLGNK